MAEADADGLPLIDAVLEQALRRMRRGERIDVAQYCHDYPDLADELRPSLRAMVFLESPLYSPHHSPKPPGVLDDYLILGELGKGSMGVVYEAIQRSLRRRVALKVINKLQGNDKSQLDRFQREAVTADIYSLGLTLFELLEGRPVRTSNGQPELMRQAFHGQTPKLAKQLPADLKTICYKCIEREPSDRYASAAALADDLSRFLSGRPIASRRLGLAERSVRWGRRHPTIVALAGCLLLVSVIGIAVAAKLSSRADHLASEAKANFEQAERNLGLVLNTVDQFCATFGADHRLDRPEFKQLKDQLLQATVELNATFVGNPAIAAKAKLQLARIHLRLAALMMGQQTLAEVYDELLSAQALLLELLAADKDLYEVEIELIRCDKELAHNRHQANELESAEQFYRASLSIADAMTAAGKQPSAAAEKARTLRLFGEFLTNQRRFEEAERSFREARSIYVAQSDEAPLEPSLALELALVDRSLATSYLANIRNWRKAEQPLLDSIASFEILMEEPTRSPRIISLYAELLGQQAKFFQIANQRQQAVSVLEQATELLSELVGTYETVVDYQLRLATSLRKLADALSLLDGQDARLLELLERAAELQSQIVLNDPNNSLNVLTFASTLLSQADVLTASQDYNSALAKAERAIQLLDDLLTTRPEHPLAIENRHHAGVKRAECLTELGRFEESFSEWERAVQLAPPMLADYTLARAARARILAGQYEVGTQLIDKLSAEAGGSSPQMQVLAECAAAYALAARQALLSDDAADSSTAESYAQRAIALLRQWAQQTQQSGIDAKFIDECADLDCLREREDFRSLLNSATR